VVLEDFDPGALVLLQDVLQVVLLIRHASQLQLVGQINLAINI